MALLKFKWDALRPLVEHALNAPEHSQVWFEQEEGIPPYPALFFVKDDGIYLMSNGKPMLQNPKGTGHLVVYAEGFDPNKDEDVWERAVDAVGGDDFGEPLPIEPWWLEEDATHFCLEVTETQLRAFFTGRRASS